MANLSMTGSAFILQVHSPPGLCTNFLFPFTYWVAPFHWCYFWSDFILRSNLWSSYNTDQLVGLGGIITILPWFLLRSVKGPAYPLEMNPSIVVYTNIPGIVGIEVQSTKCKIFNHLSFNLHDFQIFDLVQSDLQRKSWTRGFLLCVQSCSQPCGEMIHNLLHD